jgi:Tol biopolymer transport system component
MNLRGQHRRRIFAPDVFAFNPSVSPDGRTIKFGAEDNVVVHGRKLNLKADFTVRMNGTHLRQIVPFTVDAGGTGEWSPNGKRIDDGSQVDRKLDQPSNLFTMRPDGSDVRYLTHYRSRGPDFLVGAGTYSPDGRWIVFKHQVKDRYVLLKIRNNGTHLTRLRTFKANFFDRDWGPKAS